MIDPIDGTNDFIDQTGFFAVQIGLAVRTDDGFVAQVGVVYHAAEDRMYFARDGAGAWVEAADAAEEDLSDAQRFLDSGQWGAALSKANDAVESLEVGCWQVNAEFLEERVGTKAQDLDRRIESLRRQGAAEVLPPEWAAFTAQVASVQAPPATSD